MKKGIRQKRQCNFCGETVAEYYYEGRFKGYGKTCKAHSHSGIWNRGERNHKWKGGRFKRDGYIYVLDESRYDRKGASRYLGEHTINAQKNYGRKVGKDEVVHHLNGIRDDNRKENLVIVKKKGHETWTYVRELQKRISELENLCQQLKQGQE